MIETGHTEHQTDTRTERSAAAAEPPSAPAHGHETEFPLERRATTLRELCRSVLADIAARFPDRTAVYAPDPDPELTGAGVWDPRRLAYAVTILLEDALRRTGDGGPVALHWREHDDFVVLRVEYPRPLEQGDRFVTFFEHGVPPDGADDSVGVLRIVAARKIARQHGGDLARIRTRAGTAYVLELPRGPSAGARDAGAW